VYSPHCESLQLIFAVAPWGMRDESSCRGGPPNFGLGGAADWVRLLGLHYTCCVSAAHAAL